ncbi:MAG: glycosyltransferase family 4 protein [Anaerolineae bacterium]
MRIGINAFYLGAVTTGSGQYINHLIRQLTQLGDKNEYVLIKDTGCRIQNTNHSPSPFCILHPVPTPFDSISENLAKLWFEQVSFPRTCLRQGVELAHVPYFASPLFPTTPTVVTVHDLIPMLLPAYRGSILVRLYTLLVAVAARKANIVLTDSEASKWDIVHLLDIPAERVRVIYLAVENIYQPVLDEHRLTETRRKYGLPESYLLYLGGFDQRKNVPTLLKVFAQLAKDSRSFLVVAGRLPEYGLDLAIQAKRSDFFPDPRPIVQELGIGERVVFTGWVPEEDKPALYSGARALVFPSLYEGFGLPPLEALACGTPVIASNRGSLPEIVGDGGLLLEPDDVEGLAAAMEKLLADDDLWTDLRQKGLAHAARFSWEKTARETLAVYQEVGE